ncbi:NmrA family NAD(P)-binding protein [Mesorhizobium sp.]|uniref:NmrA family NAD(P)-binding protein n=1 Tax=Mesorhizobium sp. TaxID=1871066 RepID=UPI00257B0FE6|nr:NmrA family NAD(P)-binding protein [Mesorhizobium sp.]
MPELIRRNASVPALIRDPENAEKARRLGASEVVTGNLRNPQSLENAVEGVDGVFHIGPAFAPDEACMGVAMVEAAARGGVRKFAFSSVIQPTNTRLENHASKVPVEDALYYEYGIHHSASCQFHAEYSSRLAVRRQGWRFLGTVSKDSKAGACRLPRCR